MAALVIHLGKYNLQSVNFSKFHIKLALLFSNLFIIVGEGDNYYTLTRRLDNN